MASRCSRSRTTGPAFPRPSARRFSALLPHCLDRGRGLRAGIVDRFGDRGEHGGRIDLNRPPEGAARSSARLSRAWAAQAAQSFFPCLLERSHVTISPASPGAARNFARVADARSGNELVATVNQGKAVPSPRRIRPPPEQIFSVRRGRGASSRKRSPPWRRRTVTRPARSFARLKPRLLRLELQHSASERHGRAFAPSQTSHKFLPIVSELPQESLSR